MMRSSSSSVRVAFATAVSLFLAAGSFAAETAIPLQGKGSAKAADLARAIDRAIQDQLEVEKVPSSPLSSDAEFLRRAHLDIVGVIPTAEKAAQFLDSKDADKRAKLIDELLASPVYGRHFSDIWQARLLPVNSDNRRLQSAPMIKWLEESFNQNKPWNELVSEIITAEGPQDKNGAVTFYLANNTVDKMTDQVSRLFLGVQLQCAQCHNHPFTDWKQNEYWGMAAFFMKVRTGNLNQSARNGTVPGVSEIAVQGRARPQRLPESAKMVNAKFLGGPEPKLDKAVPYRPTLASWVTSSENPYFARAMVNRMWSHFFGRGIVNPVDDMHDGNPATHPELLQMLADQFVASGFDMKHLIRGICLSESYQRTSRPATGNEDDRALFSHMAVKALTPEQLFDCLTAVTGPAANPQQARRQQANPRNGNNNPRAQFVAFFNTGEDNMDPTEFQAGIPQILRLMNSPQFNRSPLLNQIGRADQNPAKVIEHLYLSTLSRRPTAQESELLSKFISAQGSTRDAYGDILWALINSSEFTLNH